MLEFFTKQSPLLGLTGLMGGNASPLVAAGGPFEATGGDVVTSPYPDSSSTYKCHIFTNPGTFEVSGSPKNVEFFVVGGGGGAGSFYSGGGGRLQ